LGFDSFWDFLMGELRLGDGNITPDYTVQSQRVWNLLRLVMILEYFLANGMLMCIDQFLTVLTLLPLRFVVGTFLAAKRQELRTDYVRDLCNITLLLACFKALGFLHIGQLYHMVRAQSVMKLYVLYNMLQVFEKLMYSLGEDLLDALYGCSRNKSPIRFVTTLAAAAMYMIGHSFFISLQIVTLNVSVNSNDKTLLVILISSQFVELKSNCFKKFGHKNLFQLACSDVVERFEMVMFFVILVIQNTSAIGIGTDSAAEWMHKASYVGLCLLLSECVVDWLKHGFIIKFNMIDPGIYKVYHLILCGDVTKDARPTALIPSLRTVLRRFGFIPIPLAAVLLRVVYDSLCNSNLGLTMAIVIIANLYGLKLFIRIYVLGHCAKHVFDRKPSTLQPNAYKVNTNPQPQKKKEKVETPVEANGTGIGVISGATAEKYTSMYPEKYRKLESPHKLEHVSRYAYYEGRVP